MINNHRDEIEKQLFYYDDAHQQEVVADEETDVVVIIFRAGTVSYRAYSPIPESLLFRLQELNKLWTEDPDALVRIASAASSEPYKDL